MCQFKSEGGRRCPVHRHDSLAAIKHVTDRTGLERKQVEKLFVELREEGRTLGRGNADIRSWTSYMKTLEDSAGGSTVVVKNIAIAREEFNAPSKNTLYALQRLEDRALNRKASLTKELKKVSGKTGKSLPVVTEQFKKAVKGAPAVPVSSKDLLELHRKNIGADPRTAAALKAVAGVERENTPRVQHQDVSTTSSALSSIGYDPEDGRLEVSFQNNPGQVYAYRRVPKDVWESFSGTGSMYIYSNFIRGNDRYAYTTAEEAEDDAYRVRCGSCGQFRASTHSCPEKATQRVPQTIPTVLTAADLDAAQDGMSYEERWDVPPSLLENPLNPSDAELYSYLDTRDVLDGVRTVATVQDTDAVRAHFRAEGSVELPVRVELDGKVVVEGTVFLESDPEDLYDAVTTGHALKCSCADYQENYDCKHVRVLKEQGPAYLHHGDEDYINLTDTSNIDFADLHEAQIDEMAEIRAFARNNSLMDAPYPEVFNAYLSQKFGGVEEIVEDGGDVESAEDAEFYLEYTKNPAKFKTQAVRIKQEAMPEVVERNRRDYAAYQEAMLSRLEQRDPGYQDDEAKFLAHYAEAQKADIPYAYENVLDGAAGDGPGARRFGVELEFTVADGHDYATVMRNIGLELHAAGLTTTPEQQGYHASRGNGYNTWNFEEDISVEGEIISPPLDDSPDSWKQLEQVCEIVTRNGGKVNSKCGSHVHISTGSYGLSTAKHGELQRTVSEHEDVLYRAATNPYARSKQHRGTAYCAPNVNDPGSDIGLDVEDSHYPFHSEVRGSLAMDASGTDDASKSHSEFRLWDGSLNPAVIQQQIKASMAMVEHAEREAVLNGGSRKRSTEENLPLGEMLEREKSVLNGGAKHTPETLLETNRPVMRFLDTVFRREEDRRSVLAVIAKNSWQRL